VGFGIRAREEGNRGETSAANCIRFAAQSGSGLVTEKLPFRNTAGAGKGIGSGIDPEKTPIRFYTKDAKATKIDPRQTTRFIRVLPARSAVKISGLGEGAKDDFRDSSLKTGFSRSLSVRF
jgi:hypothetical protein